MKMIHAYVRRGMAGAVIETLVAKGCTDISVIEVRGLSAGLRREDYSFSVQLSQAYESITKLEIVGTDSQVEDWTGLIVRAGRTGHAGDGMVFVVAVEQAVRVRTGEMGEASLQHPSKGNGG